MPRIRTIKGAFDEIRKNDPDTALTEYRIRQLVLSGAIHSRKAGTKILLDIDELTEYYGSHREVI